jgi:predicted enzyme related to lactoylglutathione lyase
MRDQAMVERIGFLDGEPCVANLTSTDTAASCRFYGALFGWQYLTTGPEAGNLVACLLRGRPIAGILPAEPGGLPAPSWLTYLASSDVDAHAARIVSNGGCVLLPGTDFFAAGRRLVAADPGGLPFGLWQRGAMPGAAFTSEPGAISWAGVHTTDGEKVDAFFHALFGYQVTTTGADDATWSLDGRPVSGRTAGTRQQWTVYFGVENLDAAIQTAVDNGGTCDGDPAPSPAGRAAVLADPAGTSFGLVELPAAGAS